MSGLIDAEEFRKQFFELETEFRPSQIDAVFDCLYNSEILDVDKKERNMSEVRLIDANALKDAHIECPDNISFFDFGEIVERFLQTVDEQPTVDAVPVRHGEWIYTTLKRYKEYTVTCPFCGAKYHDCYDGYIDVDDFNYCPNCGAKMDGADGERKTE